MPTPAEQTPSENIGAQLNVDATAAPTEIAEFQKEFDPNAAKEPPPQVDGDSDEHDDDEHEERSARVDTELEEAPDDAAREKIRERRRQERQNSVNANARKWKHLSVGWRTKEINACSLNSACEILKAPMSVVRWPSCRKQNGKPRRLKPI